MNVHYQELEGFEPVTFGVLWCGKLQPIGPALLNTIEEMARKLKDENREGGG